jgi:serine/threonine protein kinase/sugar lactone lactonase YvrE
MSDGATQKHSANLMPPASSFTGPVAELVAQGMLAPPSRPGLLATLDHFEILRVLGAGGMGIVLLARDAGTQREAAIKLIKPELVADSRIVHLFVKEARHLQRLRHPNVIEVSELSEREAGPYLVMPYFEKGSLARRIQPGKPLDEDTALDIAIQICNGLDFAHRRGIIHRDLKPANILLSSRGQACLADFGLARTMFNDSIVDVEGEQCEGTGPYMSPGVAAGNAEDTRCDIYSFGALLYEMLTGEPPYKGRTTKEIRQQIIAQPPRPIRELNPKANPGLVAVAEGAMGRELRDRYAGMADVLADLQRVKEGKAPGGPHGLGTNLRGKLHPVLWIFAPVLVGALGLLLWQVLRETQNPIATSPAIPTHETQAETSNAAPQTGSSPQATNVVSNPARQSQPPEPVPPPQVAEAPKLQAPWGLTLDPAGNLYAADSDDCTVCKLTPQGLATILAGQSGRRGTGDGPAKAASFVMPLGAAVDTAGNVYVADSYTIRKISPSGEVTTLAGLAGYPGTDEGEGNNARFSFPSGLAVDRAGNVYVADRYVIRKITPAGWVTTLAGTKGHAGLVDGQGANARFSDREKGLAVDAAGNIYVADAFNHAIRKISPDGTVTTLAGSMRAGAEDGAGAQASFSRPMGITVDGSGTVYVADTLNDTIRKITPDGTVSTLAGAAGRAGNADGAGNLAQFNSPVGIVADSKGNLYVADKGNGSIRKVTPAGVVSTLTGKKKS